MKPLPADPLLLDVLIKLALGELDTGVAAASLSMTEADFLERVEERPDLVAQAEQAAATVRSSPERTINRSTSGLASSVEVLAKRIETQGDAMTTSELVQASSLLEKLLAFSKSREAEVKQDTKPANRERLPFMIHDTRPNRVTGEGRFVVFLVSPKSRCWIDLQAEGMSPAEWLAEFAPLSPITGDMLADQLAELTKHAVRFMDAHGRIFGEAA